MAVEEFTIKEITNAVEIEKSVDVIRKSFRTVAKEFGLTKHNCPTHPSFITINQLKELKSKGVTFFGLFLGNKQIGFIAVEKADVNLYYIEKLAVLPANRHRGYGTKLMGFAFDYIRENNGKKISIGIINEHTVLKSWYIKLSFREVTTEKFPHLPFTVCFMERDSAPITII